jgi:uncharacterized protein GlcG (DUF336 family)
MSKGTMPRAIRVPDEVWKAALAKAQAEGTTVTAVVVEALREFALMPPQP